MHDDIDREVCGKLLRDLKNDSVAIDWEAVNETFNDPGTTLHLVCYRGTSLERKATIHIEYGHNEYRRP